MKKTLKKKLMENYVCLVIECPDALLLEMDLRSAIMLKEEKVIKPFTLNDVCSPVLYKTFHILDFEKFSRYVVSNTESFLGLLLPKDEVNPKRASYPPGYRLIKKENAEFLLIQEYLPEIFVDYSKGVTGNQYTLRNG